MTLAFDMILCLMIVGTAAAALRSVKGRVRPPAASAREPRAVDLMSARRVTPPGDS